MRILHVLSQRPDATGSGIYIQAMLREAAAQGHDNFLVAGAPADQPVQLTCIDDGSCAFVTFSDHAIPHPIVGMSDVMPYPSTRFCDLTADDLRRYETVFGRQITLAADRFVPDIVHSHHLWIVTALARRSLPDVPMVATCHGSDLRQFANCPHLRPGVLDGCRRLDAVMALSKAQGEAVVHTYGLPPDTVHVVGAGYQASLFARPAQAHGNPVRMVYAGKLSRAKGVPWMLRALQTIDTPAWHLDLVGGGSGPEKTECIDLAARLGRRVTVHGPVPQTRLAGIMRRAHLFVLPSFFEGLPLVVLEALACGCRVVATALPGLVEMVGHRRDEAIHLVPMPRLREVDKPLAADLDRFTTDLRDALAAQMRAAARRPRIDQAPLADVMSAYTWAGVFKRVQAVYHTAMTRRRTDDGRP